MSDTLRRTVAAALQHTLASSAKDITGRLPSGTVLVVAPHPDDETLGCGAMVARLRAAGNRVCIVVVTNGAHSTRSGRLSPQGLTGIRRQELANAAARLGVAAADVRMLDYPDGGTTDEVNRIADDLAVIVQEIRPVLCLSPLRIDTHPDHVATSRAIVALCARRVITCPLYEYPVWIWTPALMLQALAWAVSGRAVKVSTKGFLEKKRAALQEHRSQFENITGEENWKKLTQEFAERYMKRFEVFFRLSMQFIVDMHVVTALSAI